VVEGEEEEGPEIANLRGPTSFIVRSPFRYTTELEGERCGELEIEMQAVRERSLRHRRSMPHYYLTRNNLEMFN
jgi:hypothetical protein